MYYNQVYTRVHCLVVWRPSLLPLLVFLTQITPVHYLFTIIQNWEFCGRLRNQKSRLKDENVIWPILMSGITILGWSSFASHGTRTSGVVTFPEITITRWRADVNRKEYQRRAIRKSSARQDRYSVRCAAVRISLVRSVPLFHVFPMFTLSLDPAHDVITSNLSKLHTISLIAPSSVVAQ